MRLVVRLLLRRRHLQMATHLVPHHLLREDAVANIRFEVLKRHALFLRRLLQVLHRIQVVLFADIVQPANHLGIHIQAQLLASRQQQLLVDQVAQQILLPCLDLLRRRPALLPILLQLLFGALQVAAADNLIVHPRDHILHHHAVRRNRGRGRQHHLGGGFIDRALILRLSHRKRRHREQNRARQDGKPHTQATTAATLALRQLLQLF